MNNQICPYWIPKQKQNNPMRLGIIGSAGRGADFGRITKPMWNEGKRILADFIASRNFTTAVSGGSAFFDHYAVQMARKQLIGGLELYFPCGWEDQQFESTNISGKRLNELHRKFSNKMGINSLMEIETVIRYNYITVDKFDGFFARNDMVAKQSDSMIAFTFGSREKLSDGGTAYTMGKFIAEKGNENAFHVDLNEMKLYSGAIL